ncbi:mpv17-like protein [Pectinophora gossypiella]|uniref:mpv17-like protein n=1 Tax=Pectinophora gossypiella TaxID=13191 RepID=UPI00214E9842|nr:mpv17-like protein [Pectinophora gossypiella]
MISYAIIWPCCSLTQEYLEFGTPIFEANWPRAARFGFFGAFFMSPVFYNWMRISSKMKIFRRKTLGTAIKRALIEQVSYGPLALCYFLFGMSVLEMKTLDECVKEVKQKFWITYKTGAIYWPVTQTLNFYFVSEKNRIIFVSLASYVWTCYLAHIKSMH